MKVNATTSWKDELVSLECMFKLGLSFYQELDAGREPSLDYTPKEQTAATVTTGVYTAVQFRFLIMILQFFSCLLLHMRKHFTSLRMLGLL
jgi:hypothetical protein